MRILKYAVIVLVLHLAICHQGFLKSKEEDKKKNIITYITGLLFPSSNKQPSSFNKSEAKVFIPLISEQRLSKL